MAKDIEVQKLKSAVKYINNWADFNFKNSRLPGLVLAISYNDKLVLEKAYGYADEKRRIRMKPDHIFAVASHSKSFTSTAIFQLREAGKIGLDDPVSKYLPWFKSAKNKEIEAITIRNLLNHTSGIIRDGENVNYWQLEGNFPKADELRNFVNNPKLHILKINQYFKYSNYAYGYLGMVIEAVSGAAYSLYVKKNIIEKLNLSNTYPDYKPKIKSKMARGHSNLIFNKKRYIVDNISTQALTPATGFCSTATDLCKFFSAHYFGNEFLISDTSKREMHHGNWGTDTQQERYGLGITTYIDGQNKMWGHGGGFPGYMTDTRFEPEQKLVISVLTNATDGPAAMISDRIANIIDYFLENSGDIKDASKYEGTFFSQWGPQSIVNVNGKLIATGPAFWSNFRGGNLVPLKKINNNTFQIEKASGYGSAGEEVRFNFGPNGKIKSVSFAGMDLIPEKDYLSKLNKLSR